LVMPEVEVPSQATPARFRRGEYARDLMAVLVLKELRVRYKRTVLGYAWSLLQPLAFAAVYYLVFKQFIKIETGDLDYTLFLICGLFAWQWFSNGVVASTVALISNGPLITKVSFPRVYAVLSGVLNDLVHFLLASPVVFGFVFWFGGRAYGSWLWLLPMLLLIQGVLVLGLSLLLAAATLFLRDLERLTSIGMLMLFHLTPVVYPATLIPERFLGWVSWNPMFGLIVSWRDALLTGRVDFGVLSVSMVGAASALVLGAWVFAKFESRFAEVV